MTMSRFAQRLSDHGLELTRGVTTTLQVNVGLACDLACRHCHLGAGPWQTELMTSAVIEDVIACAARIPFACIDITGGAPELLPELPYLLSGLAERAPKLIVRSNLTALSLPGSAALPELYRDLKVSVVASLPAVNASQTESQRGSGAWDTAIRTLQKLNVLGYGLAGSGLVLDLVSNPVGAFLPPAQAATEKRFRQELARRHDISFNRLFTFANVPLGRYLEWLESSGNLSVYREKLESCFNPSTLPGLMCRSLISVNWLGIIHDCDFNLAAGLQHGRAPLNISELHEVPSEGTPIPVGDHCFACTAGSGFT